jgi:hypothetical protein
MNLWTHLFVLGVLVAGMSYPMFPPPPSGAKRRSSHILSLVVPYHLT